MSREEKQKQKRSYVILSELLDSHTRDTSRSQRAFEFARRFLMPGVDNDMRAAIRFVHAGPMGSLRLN